MTPFIQLAIAFITGASPAPKPVVAPQPVATPQVAPIPLFQSAVSADRSAAADLAAQTPPSAEIVARTRQTVQHEAEAGRRGKLHHRFRFSDGIEVEFSDRPRRRSERARRDRVVVHAGVETADREPASTFEAAGRAAGVTSEAVTALKYVSGHEGGFDAINTWDSARFSWGFIQFAGGRGLPPLLAHMKERNPQRFAELLGRYGVGVQSDAKGNPEPIYVDPASGKVLRGDAAEQAYGDDPLVIAAFIRAARFPEIKQLQIEAAIENYVSPALEMTWRDVPLGQVFKTPKSLALLIDRKVHEGNTRRFRRALDRVCPDPAIAPALESQVAARVVNEAVARSGAMIRNRLVNIWTSDLPGPQ